MHFLNQNISKFNQYPNLSLFYYKYTPDFVHNTSDKDIKKNFLFDFSKQKPHKALLENRLNILKKYSSAQFPMRNISRFISGVGYTSTVEWGLGFDWTTGAPYLPGSSFKGALLSYLEFWKNKPVDKWEDSSVKLENEDEWSKEEVYKIFGPQGEKIEKANTGAIVFLDAYPGKFNGFEVDVITPHNKNYYINNKPPADTENPVPIPFLTVKKGSAFLFMYKIRKSETVPSKLIEKLNSLILEAGKNQAV